MNEDLVNELNELIEKRKCPQNYRCIMNISQEQGLSKIHAKAGLTECLDSISDHCDYSAYFASMDICKCRIREIISLNYEKLY